MDFNIIVRTDSTIAAAGYCDFSPFLGPGETQASVPGTIPNDIQQYVYVDGQLVEKDAAALAAEEAERVRKAKMFELIEVQKSLDALTTLSAAGLTVTEQIAHFEARKEELLKELMA